MGKLKIRLDTLDEIKNFVEISSCFKGKVELVDGTGYRVNAKSLLGALYTFEWKDVWVESDEDIYSSVKEYVVW